MKIIAGYVARHVLAASLIVLLAIIGLDFIFRIVDEAGNTTQTYTFAYVMVYELLRTPSRVYEFMPMVGLIGCLAGLGALANSSELVVMRATGVSTYRLLAFALVPALLLLLVSMWLGEVVAPKTDQMAEIYKMQAKHYDNKILSRGVWVRDGQDFVQIQAVHDSGILYGVSIFRFQAQQLSRIIQAKRAVFSQQSWLLEDVQITQFEQQQGKVSAVSRSLLEQYTWQSQLEPELLATAAKEPKDMNMPELWTYIDYLQNQALNSAQYQLAFWQKAFYPLVMMSLVLVGISFVFGPLRQVSMGYRVFCGILLGVILKTLQDTLGPISVVYGFSAIYAMLVPVLLCLLIGLVLLSRVR